MTLRSIELPTLTTEVRSMLQSVAMDGLPYEVCGLLHKNGAVEQYPNTFPGDQRHGFDMDVNVDMSKIEAIWHSHPSGRSSPSPEDVTEMQKLFVAGFCLPWIIITLQGVIAWTFEFAIA